MVHRSGPIGPPDRVPGLRQAAMQEPSPWSGEEGANGADKNNRPDRTNTFSFTPTTGAKGNCAYKRLRGSIPRQATRWVWRVTAAVSEDVGGPPLACVCTHLHTQTTPPRQQAQERGHDTFTKRNHHEPYQKAFPPRPALQTPHSEIHNDLEVNECVRLRTLRRKPT